VDVGKADVLDVAFQNVNVVVSVNDAFDQVLVRLPEHLERVHYLPGNLQDDELEIFLDFLKSAQH